MELPELINKINQHQDDRSCMYFPYIVADVPYSFTQQECDIDGIDYVWVGPLYDGPDHTYGVLAYKFDGSYLVFEFSRSLN